jgi:hypothetical protein
VPTAISFLLRPRIRNQPRVDAADQPVDKAAVEGVDSHMGFGAHLIKNACFRQRTGSGVLPSIEGYHDDIEVKSDRRSGCLRISSHAESRRGDPFVFCGGAVSCGWRRVPRFISRMAFSRSQALISASSATTRIAMTRKRS